MQVCLSWQVQFLIAQDESNPHTRTCISTQLPTQDSHTSHRNSLASVTAGGGSGSHTHVRTHSRMRHSATQTQCCCLPWAYPFDPLTGTRRISKREEKAQSRSAGQRRALSTGSCRTPQSSRGRQCLSQEAITLHSGSEVCLVCYLHLSGWGAGGQEVRQEWDYLYHVLCMTCGMCLNIYMCLKVMQIDRKKKGGGGHRAILPLSTKTQTAEHDAIPELNQQHKQPLNLLIRTKVAYINILKVSDQVLMNYSINHVQKDFCLIQLQWAMKAFFPIWSHPLTTRMTFKCEHWFYHFTSLPLLVFRETPSGQRYVETPHPRNNTLEEYKWLAVTSWS